MIKMYENIPLNKTIESYFIYREIMRYEAKLYDTLMNNAVLNEQLHQKSKR